jgi:membrane protein
MSSKNETSNAKVIRSLVTKTVWTWVGANTPRLAAALAYYTVLSVAPLLVVAISIGGILFGREAAQGQIMGQIQDLVGTEGAAAIQAALEQAREPAASMAAALFGIFLLLFAASAVFGELRSSLNEIWGVQMAPATTLKALTAMIRNRFGAFLMVLGIGFLLLVSLIVNALIAAAGQFVGRLIPVPDAVLQFQSLILSPLATTVVFALLFKFVPDLNIKWSDVWIGALVTALLFTGGKFFIGMYLGKASIGSAYGAAGSVVVILAWVYYSAQVFFLGAIFTHVYATQCGSLAPAKPEPQIAMS